MDIPGVPEGPAKFQQADMIRLHGTYRCMQREVAALQDEPWRCHIARCQEMKQVVTHMMSCASDRTCSWLEDCSTLRQDVKRLVGCQDDECPICIQKKEWQISISEQRSSMVDLLIQTYRAHFSHMKILHAEAVENEIYKKAENPTDYYRMLAAKKWDIEMDIEKKRNSLQHGRGFREDVVQANIYEERRRLRRRAQGILNSRHRRPEWPDAHRLVRRHR